MDTKNSLIETAEAMFNECLETLGKKAHDYANDNNAFSNFEFSAGVAGIEPTQSMMVLIGVKIARLTELLSAGKEPMNESIADTIKDCINYLAILHSYLQ
jgi:hypothetical protein